MVMDLKNAGEIMEEPPIKYSGMQEQKAYTDETAGQRSNERRIAEEIRDEVLVMERSFSSPSLERKPSLGEDPAAMTIHFLRARLLSERSISKAARQKAQQLAKKVLELERQIEDEIQLRKKAETARMEALASYGGDLFTESDELVVSGTEENTFDEHSNGRENPDRRRSEFRNNHIDVIVEGEITNNEASLRSSSAEDEKGSLFERTDEDNESKFPRKLILEKNGNEGGEEIVSSHVHKGALTWAIKRGDRKQQNKEREQRPKHFGRSFSENILPGASDRENSGHRRWMGKSVRQIRKKETSPATDEKLGEAVSLESEEMGTPAESGSLEDLGSAIQKRWADGPLNCSLSQNSPEYYESFDNMTFNKPDDLIHGKEHELSQDAGGSNGEEVRPNQEVEIALHYNNGDFQVEEILENQTKLKQYEAEERAQRQWEFREKGLSSSLDLVQGVEVHTQFKGPTGTAGNTKNEEDCQKVGGFSQPMDDAMWEAKADALGTSQQIDCRTTLVVDNCCAGSIVVGGSPAIDGKRKEGAAVHNQAYCQVKGFEDSFEVSKSVNNFQKTQEENRVKTKGKIITEGHTRDHGTVLEINNNFQMQTEIVGNSSHQSEMCDYGVSCAQGCSPSRAGAETEQERTELWSQSQHSVQPLPDTRCTTLQSPLEHSDITRVEGGHSIGWPVGQPGLDKVGSFRKSTGSSPVLNVHTDHSIEKNGVLTNQDFVADSSQCGKNERSCQQLADFASASKPSQQQLWPEEQVRSIDTWAGSCSSKSVVEFAPGRDVSINKENLIKHEQGYSLMPIEDEHALLAGERQVGGQPGLGQLYHDRYSDQNRMASIDGQHSQSPLHSGRASRSQASFPIDQLKLAGVSNLREQIEIEKGVVNENLGQNERSIAYENLATLYSVRDSRRAGSDGFSDSSPHIPGEDISKQDMKERTFPSHILSDMASYYKDGQTVMPDPLVDPASGTIRGMMKGAWFRPEGFIHESLQQAPSEHIGLPNPTAMTLQKLHYGKNDGQIDLSQDYPAEEATHEKLRTSVHSYKNPYYPNRLDADFCYRQSPNAPAFLGRSKSERLSSVPARRAPFLGHSSSLHNGVGGFAWEDMPVGSHHNSAGSHHNSVDGGLDKINDVLMILQLAKQQIQTSAEQVPLSTYHDSAKRNRYESTRQFLFQPGSPVESPYGYPDPLHYLSDVASQPPPYTRVSKPIISNLGSMVSMAYTPRSSRKPGSGMGHVLMQDLQ